MAKMRPFLACLILLFIGFSAQAQFYTTGSESASIRFNSIKDSRLELIYPEGHDSLALDWKQTLLKYVPPTAVRLPVVLHTSLSTSNGMVAYPPLRMDLYTSPDMYNPVAVPWRDHLIIHESRHVEQIEFGFRKPFRWIGVLTGGISEAMVSALYNEQALMEGDAVLSETLLTGSGSVLNISGKGSSAEVDASGFAVESSAIDVAGVTAKVAASGNLELNLDKNSEVTYSGNPKIGIVKILNSSVLRK